MTIRGRTRAGLVRGDHRLVRVGYDAELRRHDEVLRRAWGVQRDDHVLDIGCGTGQTTRAAARTARAGGALGVEALQRLRQALATHLTDDGVWFDSRAWIITAVRR